MWHTLESSWFRVQSSQGSIHDLMFTSWGTKATTQKALVLSWCQSCSRLFESIIQTILEFAPQFQILGKLYRACKDPNRNISELNSEKNIFKLVRLSELTEAACDMMYNKTIPEVALNFDPRWQMG